MIPARWRPALRIALRDLRKSPGRAALVIVMVGLPVLLVSVLATLFRTADISAVESIPRTMGSTQALADPQGRTPIDQNPQGEVWVATKKAPPLFKPWTAAEIERVTKRKVQTIGKSGTLVRTSVGAFSADAFFGEFQKPELAGYIKLNSGRYPAKDNEILVSPALADRGFSVGATVTAGEKDSSGLKVVGIGRTTADDLGPNEQIIARPKALIAGERTSKYLLDGAPVSWSQVREFNKKGLAITSRTVLENPPANWKSTLNDSRAFQQEDSAGNQTQNAILLLIVFSIVLEIILLAGPAFAVGERRQRRHLALMAASGASPADVRRVILVQGIVSGVLAALIGAGLSLPVSALVAWAIPQFTPRVTFGPFDIYWVMLAAAGALGAVASLAAAFLPARAASRLDVVAVLAGRSGQARQRLGLPLVGGLLFTLGLAVVLVLGTKPGGEIKVAGGAILLVAGALMLTPVLLGGIGRLGRWLPLPLRLAARDSARQRSRTTPAVAAIMGAVAALTAISVGLSSDSEQSRRDYQPRLVAGATEVRMEALGNAWQRADTVVAQYAPGKKLQPVGELMAAGSATEGKLTQAYVPTAKCPKKLPQGSFEDTEACLTAITTTASDNPTLGFIVRNNLVAEPAAVAALGISLSTKQREVLAGGGALVSEKSAISAQGTVDIQLYQNADNGPKKVAAKVRQLPAAYANTRRPVDGAVEYTGFIVTPQTAQKVFGWRQNSALITPGDNPLSKETEAKIEEALKGVTNEAEVYTERGFVSYASLPLLLLLLTSGLVVLVGTLTATSLALADSKPDSATLAAIGANPSTRRALAAGQAVVIGLLGVLSGIVVGLVPGIAVAFPLTQTSNTVTGIGLTDPIIDLPWTWLAVLALGVPLLAALVAGSSVRSRMVLTRRLGQ